jgi:hypothetical protein
MYKDLYPPLEAECYYHIYNRGINGEDLFKEERNYCYFKTLLIRHILPCADIFAYCLLNNHFHLCIQMKKAILFQAPIKPSRNFSNFFNAYTKTINKNYKRTGSLFETPFKRKRVTSDSYITQLIYYVHGNSQKHGFVNDFREYPYSSYRDILNTDATIINCQEVMRWFGSKELFIKYHELYRRDVMQLSGFD